MTLLTETDLMRAQREREAAWAEMVADEAEDLDRELERLRHATRVMAAALAVFVVVLAVGLALA